MQLGFVKRVRESFSAKIIMLVASSVIMTSFVVGLTTTRSTGKFLTDQMKDRFDRIDANGDGQLDEAEIKAMLERMRDAAGRRPDGGRPGAGRPEGGRPAGRPESKPEEKKPDEKKE